MSHLSLTEMLSYAYWYMIKDLDSDQRRRIELALQGRIGESGGEIVDDPDLPASLQGKEAPSWWSSDFDPFADQHELSGSDASFHGVA